MLGKISNFKESFRRPSLSTDKNAGPGLTSEQNDTTVYLRQEVQAARVAVDQLDKLVVTANSFREKAAEVLSEAHRALSRLEQALSCKKDAQELISVACEIKVAAVRGQTLVKVHGSYSFVGKMVTLVARSNINKKFDKVCERLQKLLPHSPEPPRGTINSNSSMDRNAEQAQKPNVEELKRHHEHAKPCTGTVLRTGKHDRVHALVCIGNSESGSIWWSVNQNLEFFSPTTLSTTAIPLEKPALVITCIAMDMSGNMWTGHIKGAIRVNRKLLGDYCIEDNCFSLAITAMGFDSSGNAWIGDQSGRIKVVRYDEINQRLELISTLQKQQVATTPRQKPSTSSADHRAPAYLFGTFTAPSRQECTTASATVEGPVRCIYIRGNKAWIAGGRYSGWLIEWDSATYLDSDSWECGSYGPCHAITSVSINNLVPQRSGRYASGALGENVAVWRLVTGHENGQLLLWNPDDKLVPLLKIGDNCSPVKGIVTFPEYNLLCTAHGNGDLHVFVQPQIETLLASKTQNQALGLLKPKVIVVKAHKSNLSMMVGAVDMCVTASTLGTVRLWSAKDLLLEAERQGLLHVPSIPRNMALATSSSEGHALASLPSKSDSVKRTHSVTEGKGRRPVRNLSNGSMDETLESSSEAPTLASTARSQASELNLAMSNIGVQQIESSELRLIKLIGSGAYGKVWLADWTGTNVAAKELVGFQRVMEEGGEGLQQYKREYQALLNEVQLLGSLSHPNIMRFCAVCLNPPMIVTQYYSHGSLFDLLKRARRGNSAALKGLSWAKRLDMLRDVAAGMQYLHTRKPSVIHGDLRSPNLLLDLTIETNSPRYHVKIADFGLARMLGQQGNTIAVSKTTNPRWSAPEVIKESMIGKAADVYSFGIIMWELLTWTQPFEDMLSVQVIFSTVSESNRPELPPDNELPGHPGVTLPAYRELMQQCWAQNKEDRPGFEAIVQFIEKMVQLERQQHHSHRQHAGHRVRSEPASGQSSPPAPSSNNSTKGIHDSAMTSVKVDVSANYAPPLSRSSAPQTQTAMGSPHQVPHHASSVPSSASSTGSGVDIQALLAERMQQQYNHMAPITEETGHSPGHSFSQAAQGRATLTANNQAIYNPFALAAADPNHLSGGPASPFSAAQPNRSPFSGVAGDPWGAASVDQPAQGYAPSVTNTPEKHSSSSPFANAPNTSPFSNAPNASPFSDAPGSPAYAYAPNPSPFASAPNTSPFANSSSPVPAPAVGATAPSYSPFANAPNTSPFANSSSPVPAPAVGATAPNTSPFANAPNTSPFAAAQGSTSRQASHASGTSSPGQASAALAPGHSGQRMSAELGSEQSSSSVAGSNAGHGNNHTSGMAKSSPFSPFAAMAQGSFSTIDTEVASALNSAVAATPQPMLDPHNIITASGSLSPRHMSDKSSLASPVAAAEEPEHPPMSEASEYAINTRQSIQATRAPPPSVASEDPGSFTSSTGPSFSKDRPAALGDNTCSYVVTDPRTTVRPSRLVNVSANTTEYYLPEPSSDLVSCEMFYSFNESSFDDGSTPPTPLLGSVPNMMGPSIFAKTPEVSADVRNILLPPGDCPSNPGNSSPEATSPVAWDKNRGQATNYHYPTQSAAIVHDLQDSRDSSSPSMSASRVMSLGLGGGVLMKTALSAELNKTDSRVPSNSSKCNSPRLATFGSGVETEHTPGSDMA